jgi:hypothetical protein
MIRTGDVVLIALMFFLVASTCYIAHRIDRLDDRVTNIELGTDK